MCPTDHDFPSLPTTRPVVWSQVAAEETQAQDLPNLLHGTQKRKKKSFRSTGSAHTNPNDAANNSTVSGSPEDRDDHQLNSGEK